MWDKARDVITILLLPALGWVLMVSRAIETERIHAEALKRDVAQLSERVDRLQERNEATSLQLVRLETRLNNHGSRSLTFRIERFSLFVPFLGFGGKTYMVVAVGV